MDIVYQRERTHEFLLNFERTFPRRWDSTIRKLRPTVLYSIFFYRYGIHTWRDVGSHAPFILVIYFFFSDYVTLYYCVLHFIISLFSLFYHSAFSRSTFFLSFSRFHTSQLWTGSAFTKYFFSLSYF